MRRLPVLAIGLVVSVLILHAADISGIWLGSVTGGRRNQVQDFAFQFIQKGATLTGKLYLDYGSTPILKGTIDGDQISFQVVAREQAGNEINQAVLRFTGTLKDGEIEITREREEIRAAGNSGAAFARPGSQTFRLKRLP
ncbi:MAG TPA: hypothetical protein VNY05_20560 [Candidatus Acidoferrales bacterium]|jgi:hypothetical protein|nr:hypothetical protein [Candidatus Acidoferrales bacterium]